MFRRFIKGWICLLNTRLRLAKIAKKNLNTKSCDNKKPCEILTLNVKRRVFDYSLKSVAFLHDLKPNARFTAKGYSS